MNRTWTSVALAGIFAGGLLIGIILGNAASKWGADCAVTGNGITYTETCTRDVTP